MKPGRGLLNGSVIPDVPHTFERETSCDSNNSTEQYNVTNSKEPYTMEESLEEISETTLNLQINTTQINETTWNNEELDRVVYRCYNDLLMDGDGGDEHYRECVDGQWTEATPECGESRE